VLRKRSIGTLAALAAVVAAIGGVGSALADDDANDRVLSSELIGNVRPADGGATLFGVPPAGASWVVASSDVDVRRDGRIKVKFEGLVLVTTGGVGNNTAVIASLFCDGEEVASTAPFALSPEGDGETDTNIGPVPNPCRVPTVFVRPARDNPPYFAVTGA
jgi:hypothetical protein